MAGKSETPTHPSHDVIIVDGAIVGSSTAWFLIKNKDFNGKILVVERDTIYESSSTAHTNSCMRQQFSAELNVRISQLSRANALPWCSKQTSRWVRTCR